MKTMKQPGITKVVGTLVFGSLASVATTANANPFTAMELASGYEMVASEGKCGEGKCGSDKSKQASEKAKEAKCGEGKCGEDKMKGKADKTQETTDKTKEAKCGEGKCGEGKCGSAV